MRCVPCTNSDCSWCTVYVRTELHKQLPCLATPQHRVFLHGSGQVREYPALVIAEADMAMAVSDADNKKNSGSSSSATSAFQTLAGYIFGANSTNTKMAMTTPVFTQLVDTRPSTMQFVVPSSEVSVYVHGCVWIASREI